MNIVDGIIGVLAAIAAFRGYRRGLVGQVFEYGGGLAGLAAGVVLGPRVASRFTEEAGITAVVISLVVVFIGLSLGQVVGHLLGSRFARLARKAHFGPLNAMLGAVSGVLVVVVAFWITASLLVQAPSRPVARSVGRSRVLAVLNSALPEPPNVVAYLRHYLDTSGFPQVFAGLPRQIGPPVDLPGRASARRAASKAQGSTVRVLAAACGGVQVGSGWVSGGDTVTTNAHVVAGAGEVTVEDSDGRHSGAVVLFDPGTDVALVHVEGLAGPPLELATTPQVRSQPGATLGFPGTAAGRLVIHRAAVQDRYQANGLDIYGRSPVARDVYELRSPVREGDSGGPFVLPDGRVAGVVFAASTTDGDTGYALTASEVASQVAAGAATTRPVPTGPCTR